MRYNAKIYAADPSKARGKTKLGDFGVDAENAGDALTQIGTVMSEAAAQEGAPKVVRCVIEVEDTASALADALAPKSDTKAKDKKDKK